jgi:hypothetical protein
MHPFKINRTLDHIFNHCIELMYQGQSIEDCVKLYDSKRIQLLPLLKAAQITIATAQSVKPRKDIKKITKLRLLSTIKQIKPVSNIGEQLTESLYLPIKLRAFVKSIFVNKKLDEIVNHCIGLMNQGQSIEDCLKLYESSKADLAPLLEYVAISMNAARSVDPREPAKQASKTRFLAAVNKTGRPSRFSVVFSRNLFRPIALPMTALVFLSVLILGSGSIAAVYSDNAIPGDNNYWIKRARENITLAITHSDTEIAQTHAKLASTRGEEMLKLIKQGRVAAAEGHLDSVFKHLSASAQHSGVSLTFNTVDAPPTKISIQTDEALGLLRVTLQQGSEVLSVDKVPLSIEHTINGSNRVDRIRYEFELAFRILLWSIDNAEQSDPFWINQSSFSR